IVRDRERVILGLRQLVERVVVPNRIEAVLDGVIRRWVRQSTIQRMSPVTRADRNVEEGRGASAGDRRDIGWVIEAACRGCGVRAVVTSPERGDQGTGGAVVGDAGSADAVDDQL